MALVNIEKAGKIAIFTINRPDALNALSSQVMIEISNGLVDFRDDPERWVAIITGAGEKAFSAGADIMEFRTSGGTREALKSFGERVRADQVWKPVIAAINGFCLGGGLELAMTCDIRIAAEHARFGQPEINIGFMPGGGGTQRLPRFVSRAHAAEMLLTGEMIDAQEAYRIGLVNRVVPLDQLMPTARQMAETICKKGPLGIQASKEAMIRGYNMPLDEGLKLERELAEKVRQTEDFEEGTKAFAERRPAEFKGK